MSTIVSGMRPTGKLHLGHYFGVIDNWLKLQSQHQCYFFAADWHSLTTEYADPGIVRASVKSILIDWLAAGIDPKKAVIFVQSHVPEHAELHLLLSMITPISWLERVPSFKDLQQELSHKELSTYGFLGYPLLQTADVALYKATHVPVGQDQVAHIELSREVVRRFNFLYKKEVLAEPQPMLTRASKILGSDGRKMSKSYDNSIYLSDSAADTEKKIKGYFTDPARKLRKDPGNPDICPIYHFHQQVSPKNVQSQVAADCRSAAIGCVDCKKLMLSHLNPVIEPLRERRSGLEKNVKMVDDIINEGAVKARTVAQKTLQEVKDVMGFSV
ncbi:tryptophan--tRNA ligase [bacterium]|nr:tryptophan--tRNA ligase [bacterium]